MKNIIAVVFSILTISFTASAAVETKEVTYTENGVELKGFLAWDNSIKEKRPGVIIVS